MGDLSHFSALPTELRLKIWGEALSERSVLAVTRDKGARFNMTSIGPPPSRVGGVCFESREVLKQLYGDPLVGSRTLGRDASWVDLENTLVYLRGYEDLSRVLETLPAETLKRFKHIALGFAPYATINLMCQRLSASCPALRTVVVFWDPIINPPTHDLTPLAAACLTAFVDSDSPYRESDVLDTRYFRLLLQPLLVNSRPRLHVVTHDQAERLEL